MFWSEIKDLIFSGDADTIVVINETDFDIAQVLQDSDDVEYVYVEAGDVKDKLKDGDYYAAFTLSDADGKSGGKN